MSYNHNSNGGAGGGGSSAPPTNVEISGVVGGQYAGKASTYGTLPTTDIEGNPLKAGDIVFLTADDIGTGTPQNPQYPRGEYEYDGTNFVLAFALPQIVDVSGKFPANSTDNAIARYDLTNGDLQDSLVTISDAGAVDIPLNLKVSGGYVASNDNEVIASDGRRVTATFPVNTRYGYFEAKNGAGRGMFLGFGNGTTDVDLTLESASNMNFSGGTFTFQGGIKYTGGGTPASGKVVTSDASGNLTLQTLSSISTIPLSVPSFGAETDVTAQATMSGSSLASPTYDPIHVKDGVLTDYGYLATPAMASTTGMIATFPAPTVLGKVRVLMSAQAVTFKSTAMTIKGRLNSGSPWVTLINDVSFSNPVAGQFVDVQVASPVAYLEYNILFTQGVSTTYRCCTEMQFISQAISNVTVQAYPFTAPDSSTWGAYVDNSGVLKIVSVP